MTKPRSSACTTTYPYGNTFKKGACNTGQESPIERLFGPNPTYNFTELNDPRCDQLSNTLAVSGSFPECVTPEGVYDMAGNLDEWVDHILPTGHGVFRGGYFVDDVINGPGCTYRTVAHAPSYHDYSLTGRCCSTE